MTADTYHNYSDEQLAKEIEDLEKREDDVKGDIKRAKNILLERKQTEIADALKKKPEPFGAVGFVLGILKATFTTPKKVTWDQKGLADLRAQMIADGADPDEYITVEYKVKEEAYKNWPSNIKEYFEPLRTVEPGNVSVKITEAKEK